MQDASRMIGRTKARATASFPPCLSLCVRDINWVHRKRTGTGSIYSIAKHPKHNCTLIWSLPRDRSIRWNRWTTGSIVGSLRFSFSPGGKYAYLLCYDAFFTLGTYELFIIPFKATSEQVAKPVEAQHLNAEWVAWGAAEHQLKLLTKSHI